MVANKMEINSGQVKLWMHLQMNKIAEKDENEDEINKNKPFGTKS